MPEWYSDERIIEAAATIGITKKAIALSYALDEEDERLNSLIFDLRVTALAEMVRNYVRTKHIVNEMMEALA